MAAAFSLPLLKNEYLRLPLLLFCLQQQQLLRQRKQSIYIAITTHTHTQFTVSQSFACFLCPLNECVSLSLLVYVSAFNLQIAKLLLLLDVQKSAWVLFPFFPSSPSLLLQFVVHSATMHKHTHTILSAAIASAGGNIQFSYLLSSSLSLPFSHFHFQFLGWIRSFGSILLNGLQHSSSPSLFFFSGHKYFLCLLLASISPPWWSEAWIKTESWAPSREPRQTDRQTLQIVWTTDTKFSSQLLVYSLSLSNCQLSSFSLALSSAI